MGWPVSVKGVLIDQRRVLLALNDRGEWELPGGRLEPSENLQSALKREFEEEANLEVQVEDLLHAWVFEVLPGRRVVVIAYGCSARRLDLLRVSDEHRQIAFHDIDDLPRLRLADGYRVAIATALGT